MSMLCQCASSRYSGSSSQGMFVFCCVVYMLFKSAPNCCEWYTLMLGLPAAQNECERLVALAEEQLVEEEEEVEAQVTGQQNCKPELP